MYYSLHVSLGLSQFSMFRHGLGFLQRFHVYHCNQLVVEELGLSVPNTVNANSKRQSYFGTLNV